MPRPLRKSPPICFRVPIECWPTLERLAARQHQTPTEFVYARTVDLVERTDAGTTRLVDHAWVTVERDGLPACKRCDRPREEHP